MAGSSHRVKLQPMTTQMDVRAEQQGGHWFLDGIQINTVSEI